MLETNSSCGTSPSRRASLALKLRVPLAQHDARFREAGFVQRGGDGARAGSQQPHVGEQERPQARAIVKGVADEGRDVGGLRVGAEAAFQFVVVSGLGVAVVLGAARQFHGENLYKTGGQSCKVRLETWRGTIKS